MHYLLMFVVLFGGVSAETIDKLNLVRNKINQTRLMSIVFGTMAVSILLFIFITHPPLPTVTLTVVGLLFLIGVVSFAANTFNYQSLRINDISLREPINDFNPIIGGLIGFIVFPDERVFWIIPSFIIGAGITYWGIHKHRIRKTERKGIIFLIAAMTLAAFIPTLYKFALMYISPEYITLFRILTIFLGVLIFLPKPKKHARHVTKNQIIYSICAGLLYAISALATIYAIAKLGVVFTMFLFILRSGLRYLASYFVFKEHVDDHEILSSVALISIILTSMLAG